MEERWKKTEPYITNNSIRLNYWRKQLKNLIFIVIVKKPNNIDLWLFERENVWEHYIIKNFT